MKIIQTTIMQKMPDGMKNEYKQIDKTRDDEDDDQDQP